jgi:hypothetical protein
MLTVAALVPVRTAVLPPGRTSNSTRPANLKAELGQITGQVNLLGALTVLAGLVARQSAYPWPES